MRPFDSTSSRPSAAVLLLVGMLLAVGVLLATSATAAELAGRITLEKRGRDQKIERGNRILVYFTPAQNGSFDAPDEPFEIITVGKNFVPRTLGVPTGSTVRFPNQDTILHNVFSVSGRNRFDLGLYRRGQSKENLFNHPGTVRVFCNVHHSMVAHLVVVDTIHIGYADTDGRFRLTDLPVGSGTLTAWYERSDPMSREVRLPQNKPLSLTLEVTKPKVPQHDDKHGRSYTRRRSRYR
jgi:plastocyanin